MKASLLQTLNKFLGLLTQPKLGTIITNMVLLLLLLLLLLLFLLLYSFIIYYYFLQVISFLYLIYLLINQVAVVPLFLHIFSVFYYFFFNSLIYFLVQIRFTCWFCKCCNHCNEQTQINYNELNDIDYENLKTSNDISYYKLCIKEILPFCSKQINADENNSGHSNINTNLLNLLSQINNLTDNDNSEDENLPNCKYRDIIII